MKRSDMDGHEEEDATGTDPVATPRAQHQSGRALRIVTLGQFQVFAGDAPVERLRGRLAELLQAIVAFGPPPISRDRLAAELWEAADGDAAHKALEVAIHRLRERLGARGYIEVYDRRVSLAPGAVWVDAWELDDRIATFDSAHARSADQCHTTLSAALALYGGHFLAGVTDAPWALAPRERLRHRIVSAIERYGSSPPARDTAPRAITLFRQALVLDPLNEAIQAGLLGALVADGRFAEARESLERFVWLTASASGESPDDVQNRLVRRIRMP